VCSGVAHYSALIAIVYLALDGQWLPAIFILLVRRELVPAMKRISKRHLQEIEAIAHMRTNRESSTEASAL
jgi:hypothetical protein